MVNIQITLSGNNESVVFDNKTYALASGLTGFGIPQPLVRIDPSAGDGGVFRFAKRQTRQTDLPIVVFGDDQATTETRLRRLARIFRGPVRLIAEYDNGDKFELICYYSGGGETQFGEDGNKHFARWVVTLQAPQPFWESVAPTSFAVDYKNEEKGLLTGSLTELNLSSSQLLGTLVLENSGDVATPITWVIRGPASKITISFGDAEFSYDAEILDVETITVNTALGTVTDQDGANQYANLAPAPKFFSLPPGVSTVLVTIEGADEGTQLAGFYKSRREVIH